MGNEHPRKVIFIDKKFQAEFILKFVLLTLVGTAVFGVVAYLILDRKLDQSYYSAHMTMKSVGAILKPTLVWLSLVFAVVFGVAAMVITLYVSHHIAGPLYAIRRYLENIARGELNFEPRLRDKDQTTPLAQSLTQAMETLNQRLIAIRGSADAVRVASQNLTVHVEHRDSSVEQCRKDLGELIARANELTRDVEFFTLRKPVDRG
jgi:methyl-accepting chemotaxis protein